MKVFKFGGASVKDTKSIQNVAAILKRYEREELIVVFSAMGKTTNRLELVLNHYLQKNAAAAEELERIKNDHMQIIGELFPDPETGVYADVDSLFLQLECYLEKEPPRKFDYLYDQIVCFGELLATRIVHAYLQQLGMRALWMDARNFIITDEYHREARINWPLTTTLVRNKMLPLEAGCPVITQGFIGSAEGRTTTLGREGSDFSAAIFSYAAEADELTLWKDVPGILSADPERVTETTKFNEMSYAEAIEMTYYGARILHPKTIKPLQNKNIPLVVRSFNKLDESGTSIHARAHLQPTAPVFIHKSNQTMLSIASRDLSFITQNHLGEIFSAMAQHRIKLNLMQNSALQFSICIDHQPRKLEHFLQSLGSTFDVSITEDLELITIRRPTPEIMRDTVRNRTVLLEQHSSVTAQFAVRNVGE